MVFKFCGWAFDFVLFGGLGLATLCNFDLSVDLCWFGNFGVRPQSLGLV